MVPPIAAAHPPLVYPERDNVPQPATVLDTHSVQWITATMHKEQPTTAATNTCPIIPMRLTGTGFTQLKQNLE